MVRSGTLNCGTLARVGKERFLSNIPYDDHKCAIFAHYLCEFSMNIPIDLCQSTPDRLNEVSVFTEHVREALEVPNRRHDTRWFRKNPLLQGELKWWLWRKCISQGKINKLDDLHIIIIIAIDKLTVE